jgi:Tfp pilus assembly protein PilX
MNTRSSAIPGHQRGAVLMIGMVMLIMLMLIAVGVIRLSTRHTMVVNNEQLRTEATAASHYALDMVLNQPADSWTVYEGAGKTEFVNLGVVATENTEANSVQVKVTNMGCKRARVLKNGELIKTSGTYKYVDAADASCFGGGGSPLTIVDTTTLGSPTDDSLCGTVLYDVQAQATDPRLLDASVTILQGVEVRRSIEDLATCD